jgi:hypothetical protein
MPRRQRVFANTWRMRTAATVFALGFVISLAGDATHVASGTTAYDWDGVPTLWKSAVWFPFAVALSVLGTAWFAERFGPPPVRRRGPADAAVGAGLVLALYGLTAALHRQPPTVSVVLTAAIAVAIWAWWDPSRRAFTVAVLAAVLGPLAEVGIVEAGAAHYSGDADGLLGVAEWLPCLYFAAGAVASGLWPAVGASRT